VKNARYVLMLAENWCGDVHRNSPLVAHIAEAIPNCELRVFLRDQAPDLRDTFLNNGYQSIPVVVFFDKDWNELGRWLERAHAATTKAANIRATTIDVAPKDDKAKQDAAMNDFRGKVNAEYHAPGGRCGAPPRTRSSCSSRQRRRSNHADPRRGTDARVRAVRGRASSGLPSRPQLTKSSQLAGRR